MPVPVMQAQRWNTNITSRRDGIGCLHNPYDGSVAHRPKCHVRILEGHGGHGHQQYRHVDYLFGDKQNEDRRGWRGREGPGLRHKSSIRRPPRQPRFDGVDVETRSCFS